MSGVGLGVRAQPEGDHRFRRRLASARRRAAAAGCAVELPARLLQHPADRPRRSTLRASHQADGGERGLHRHPLPRRGALQEACRHLLAAERRGEGSPRAWLRASSHDDLALPGAVAARRHRRCPSDLLGGACLRLAPRRAARRPHDGKLRAPWHRTAHRQDGCHAAPHGRRCDGGDGAGVSSGPTRATRTGRRLAVGGDILERARRRRAAQGAAHRHDCRAGRRRADRRRSLCPMAAGTQTAGRNRLARAAGPAMVHRDRRTCGRCVLRRVGGTRPAQQGFCRPGVLMARRPGRISCCSG